MLRDDSEEFQVTGLPVGTKKTWKIAAAKKDTHVSDLIQQAMTFFLASTEK